MDLPDVQGKTYYVVGIARSGLAAIKTLLKAGARVYAWDDVALVRDQALELGATLCAPEEAPWQSLEALILSPGIPHEYPHPHPGATLARAHKVPIVCDMDLLFQACPEASFVGITGTNGKSTTTALVGHILEKAKKSVAVGGNIGVPVLDLPVLGAQGTYVLEMSSYQLERTPHIKTDVAVLLNIIPDHLTRHGGWEGYVHAKIGLLAGEPAPFILMGVDEAVTRDLFEVQRVLPSFRGVGVSITRPLETGLYLNVRNELVDAFWEEARVICRLDDVKALMGVHNAQNVLAAYGACRALGLSFEDCVSGILSFKGLAHRLESLGTVGNIHFVNDSKATNPDAAARALACFQGVSWILGGVPKEDGLKGTGPFYPRVRRAYVIGQAQALFASTLEGRVPYTCCNTLEEAVAKAVEDLGGEEGTLLLSPACASFDQYADFEARGDDFRRLFQALCRKNKSRSVL